MIPWRAPAPQPVTILAEAEAFGPPDATGGSTRSTGPRSFLRYPQIALRHPQLGIGSRRGTSARKGKSHPSFVCEAATTVRVFNLVARKEKELRLTKARKRQNEQTEGLRSKLSSRYAKGGAP